MKTKHTKGKWILNTDNEYIYTIQSENSLHIASTMYKDDERLANSKLIAAAPELLDNLIRLIDRIEENDYQDNFPSAYRRALDAIGKATE